MTEKPLSPKQQRFAEEYIIDLNGAAAARRAGYSERNAADQARQNFALPKVQAAIQAAMAKRSQRTAITADRVLEELAKIGFASIRSVVRWGDTVAVLDPEAAEVRTVSGVALVGSDKLSADEAAAIAEVSQTKDGQIRVKMHDKQAALVSLGRHLGLFTDKVEATGNVSVTIKKYELGD